MTRTTITLPDDLNALLKDEARRLETSVSEVIRTLVTRALVGSEEKPREIPWAGIIDDPDMPAARHMRNIWRRPGRMPSIAIVDSGPLVASPTLAIRITTPR
jgi:hypothetical protein